MLRRIIKSYYKTRILCIKLVNCQDHFCSVLLIKKTLGKIWVVRLSGVTLRSLTVTDISGQLLGPILKGQA